MTREVQEQCRDLLCRYQEDLSNIEVRNKLFLIMLPTLMKWVSAWYVRRQSYPAKEEILSDTWDCFLYCVDRYSDWNVPLPSHFTRYINWFLNDKENKIRKVNGPMVRITDDYSNEYGMEDVGDIAASGSIIGASSFLGELRSGLDLENQAIFDDALTNSTVNKQRLGMPAQKYLAIKATYRKMITFFLEKV